MFLKLEPRPSSAEKANMRETRPGLSERPGVNKRHSEQEIADYFWRLWKCRSGHLCFALWWFFNNSTFSDTFYIHAKWLVWIHKSWSDWGESYFLSLTDDTQGPFELQFDDKHNNDEKIMKMMTNETGRRSFVVPRWRANRELRASNLCNSTPRKN